MITVCATLDLMVSQSGWDLTAHSEHALVTSPGLDLLLMLIIFILGCNALIKEPVTVKAVRVNVTQDMKVLHANVLSVLITAMNKALAGQKNI